MRPVWAPRHDTFTTDDDDAGDNDNAEVFRSSLECPRKIANTLTPSRFSLSRGVRRYFRKGISTL